MLRTGRLKGTKTHRWSIPVEQVLSLKKRREGLKGWPRLVDVARHLGIHRNQGEAICRRAGLPVEKDFADEVKDLEAEFDPKTLDLRKIPIRPRKSDITLDVFGLVWTPWRVSAAGIAEPLYRFGK